MVHRKLVTKVKLGFNQLRQNIPVQLVLMVPKKLVMRARRSFNQPHRNILAQLAPTVLKNQAMKAKPLFSQPIQNIPAKQKLKELKNQAMKAKPLFSQPIQTIPANQKLKEPKKQVTKVKPWSKLITLFIPRLQEVSQRLKRKPLIILSKLSLMIASMWMKKLSNKRGKKVAKKSRRFTKPLMVSRLVSQLLCQVRLSRCHNLEKSVVVASLQTEQRLKNLLQSFHLRKLSKRMIVLKRALLRLFKKAKKVKIKSPRSIRPIKGIRRLRHQLSLKPCSFLFKTVSFIKGPRCQKSLCLH